MPRNVLISSLAFTGGFVVMSVELLGGRLLAPWFGSSIYVWGSIISVFMLALAVGYYLGGWASLRQPSLLRFGLIFCVAGLGLIPMTLTADAVMTAVFDGVTDPRYGSLIAAMILFFVPTVILGFISPYSVRLLVDTSERAGRVAGTLYFFSTLGSAVGTLMTSFYFVLWFEMQTILLSLSLTLVAAGLIAISGHRRSAPDASALS